MADSSPTAAAPAQADLRVGNLVYTRRSLMVLFACLLWGDFVLVVMEQVMPNLMPLLLKDHGASNRAITLIMATIPGIVSTFLMPGICYRSDRLRTPLGRRLPLMIISTPLIVMILVAIPFAPQMAAGLGGVRWLADLSAWTAVPLVIAILGLLNVLYMLFNGVCSAGYSFLIIDVVPQAWLGRFTSFFRIFSQAAVFAFNFFVFGLAERHMKEVFIGVAVLYGLGFGWVCWKVREGGYPPVTDEPDRSLARTIRNYFAECFSHPLYGWFYLAFILYALSNPWDTFVIFFLRDELGLDLATIGRFRAAATVFVIPMGFFVGGIVDRVKAPRLAAPALLLFALVKMGCSFFIVGKWSFFAWTLATNGFAFVWGVTMGVFIPNILPPERYGQFVSCSGLITALVVIPLAPLCGQFFDIWPHYRLAYLMSSLMMFLSVLVIWRIHSFWLVHGGPEHYRAP
jgi:hypothetical protein